MKQVALKFAFAIVLQRCNSNTCTYQGKTIEWLRWRVQQFGPLFQNVGQNFILKCQQNPPIQPIFRKFPLFCFQRNTAFLVRILLRQHCNRSIPNRFGSFAFVVCEDGSQVAQVTHGGSSMWTIPGMFHLL